MNSPTAKSSLSEPERRLVDLFQQINFGRLEALRIHAGIPLFLPAPRVIETLKMGGQNGPREEVALPDFWLKQPLIDLIETIRQMEDGEILSIEVRHGLPFVVEIERAAR